MFNIKDIPLTKCRLPAVGNLLSTAADIMDPFSLSTGIVGFIGVALQVTEMLHKYINGVVSAKKDAQALLAQIESLTDVLRQFQDFLRREDLKGVSFKPTSGLSSVVALCQNELEKLLGKLSKVGSLERKEVSLARLTWPFDSKAIKESIQTLNQCTGIFHFSLTIDNCALMSKSSDEIVSCLEQQQQQLKLLSKMMSSVPADMARLAYEIDLIVSSLPYITDMSAKMDNVYTGMQRLQLDSDVKLLQWLSTLEPTKRHQDVRSVRVEGTGQWFLQTPNFEDWESRANSDSNRVLCCYGIPGAGKTVITSLVIDHLTKRQAKAKEAGHNITLAYLYCDYRDQAEQGPRNMLGSLLRQIVATLPSVPDDLRESYEKCNRNGKSLELSNIESALSNLCQSSTVGNLYVCVDALDECKDREILLRYLKTLMSQPSVRLFTTSRPHIQASLDKHFKGTLRITIEASQEDIKKFVSGEIDKDSEDDPDLMDKRLRGDIMESIGTTSQKMFLLPALQIRAVLDERTKFKRRKALKTLPHELGEAYENSFERIRQQPKGSAAEAMNILMWTHLAERPLLVEELCYALAVIPGDTEFDTDNLPSTKSWLAGCSGLVIIDEETSSVRLVHFSLQEYLSTRHEEVFPQGHARIALTCLTYIQFGEDTIVDPVDDIEKPLTDLAFFKYAGLHWGDHVRKADAYLDKSSQVIHLAIRLLRDKAKMKKVLSCFRVHWENAFSVFYDSKAPPASGLHFASYMGMTQVVKAVFNPAEVGSRCYYKRPAVFWAAGYGHFDIVRFLVNEGGAEVDPKDCVNGTPLGFAAEQGFLDIVKFLHEHDGDVNAKDDYGASPTSRACRFGHLKVVKFLIEECGTDPEVKDVYDENSLFSPAERGHMDVVKYLINERGLMADPRDEYDWTPLSAASSEGHLEVVKFLVKLGADVHSIAQGGQTPISRAKLGNHWEVVKFLESLG